MRILDTEKKTFVRCIYIYIVLGHVWDLQECGIKTTLHTLIFVHEEYQSLIVKSLHLPPGAQTPSHLHHGGAVFHSFTRSFLTSLPYLCQPTPKCFFPPFFFTATIPVGSQSLYSLWKYPRPHCYFSLWVDMTSVESYNEEQVVQF